MTSRGSSKARKFKVSAKRRRELDRIIQIIPGYDPVATAGDDCWFDYDAAQRAIDFFPECLTHQEGSLGGQPIHPEEWQEAVTANMYGWKRAPDNFRRYRTIWVFVPRKNGKTTWAAGTPLYALFCDGEYGAKVYCCASDTDQASLLYNISRGMMESCPRMEAMAQVYSATKTIVSHQQNSGYSIFKALSAVPKHGLNAHFFAMDEVHEQKDAELGEVMETSQGARDQPIGLFLTTSDFAGESYCNTKHDYAGKVRDGIIDDDTFLPVIYEASINDDWKDEKVWAKANPNLGISLKIDWLRQKCRQAQADPSFENTFKRLHLNIQTEQDVRWIQMDRWDACAGDMSYRDLAKSVEGQYCHGGLDLSTREDITALELYFPETGAILNEFWCPRDVAMKKDRGTNTPYMKWANQGYLNLSEGNVIDYDFIRKRINELGDIYEIRSIGIDPWNATQLSLQLGGDGFDIIPFRQGFGSMSDPSKDFSKKITAKEIVHAGHPVLRWMISNVSIEMNAPGDIKPTKAKSPGKIDGVVGSVMAIGCANLAIDKPRIKELFMV